jgi:protein-S-isoprenylcysteine O-methyltransferase Ste14
MTPKKIFPPTYMLISTLLMVGLGLLFPVAWIIPPYRSLLGLLPLGLGVLIDRQFIRVEEKMLAETFGEQYEAYRKQIRRWI